MRNRIVWMFLLMAGWSLGVFAQEGIYYYGVNSKPADGEEDAISYKDVTKKSERKYVIQSFQKSGDKWVKSIRERIKILGDGTMKIIFNDERILPERIYREMDQLGPNKYLFKESNLATVLRSGTSSTFLPLSLEGEVTGYHPNGEVKSISMYRDNQLVSNENWLPDGSRYIDSVFYSVDQEPEYQMGDEFFKAFLINKLKESKLDLTQIEDQVVVGWVVMETGELEGAIALKGKSRQLNDVLVNTIAELPGYWTPAILEWSYSTLFHVDSPEFYPPGCQLPGY